MRNIVEISSLQVRVTTLNQYSTRITIVASSRCFRRGLLAASEEETTLPTHSPLAHKAIFAASKDRHCMPADNEDQNRVPTQLLPLVRRSYSIDPSSQEQKKFLPDEQAVRPHGCA